MPACYSEPMTVTMDTLVSLCKRRGFVFQSSEIYGGTGSCYDYGPLGVELKNNLKRLWWRDFVQSRPDMVGIDASILMHPMVWKASGHLDNFTDPMVDCRECTALPPDAVDALPWTPMRGHQGNKSRCPPGAVARTAARAAHPVPGLRHGRLTRRASHPYVRTHGPPRGEASSPTHCPKRPKPCSHFETCSIDAAKLPIRSPAPSFRNDHPLQLHLRTRAFLPDEIEYFVNPREPEAVRQTITGTTGIADACVVSALRPARKPASSRARQRLALALLQANVTRLSLSLGWSELMASPPTVSTSSSTRIHGNR